jgi:hypothetical protein
MLAGVFCRGFVLSMVAGKVATAIGKNIYIFFMSGNLSKVGPFGPTPAE